MVMLVRDICSRSYWQHHPASASLVNEVSQDGKLLKSLLSLVQGPVSDTIRQIIHIIHELWIFVTFRFRLTLSLIVYDFVIGA